VREFPMRVKCASLAWHTLKNAVEDAGEVAKTE
jgi:nitrogen fixation NifU-like protein